MAEDKLPVGVRKRSNSKNYFYRIKCKLADGREVTEEHGGFSTPEEAEKARLNRFSCLLQQEVLVTGKTFSQVFFEFIETECKGKIPLIKKYNALYQSKLTVFADFFVNSISKNEILWLIHSLDIDNRNDKKKDLTYAYINSVKALLWRIFDFAYQKRYISTHILYFLPRMWSRERVKKESYIEPIFAYMGNKYKLLHDLHLLLPENIFELNFIDLFAGSGVVALNTLAKSITLNEPDAFLYGAFNALSTTPPETAWNMVMSVVDKYDLNPENEQGYYLCRSEYNSIPYEKRVTEYWYWGVALVYHSFNRSTLQHNRNYEFNAPFGFFKCDIEKSKKRFMPFAERLYSGDFEFLGLDFREVLSGNLQSDTFLYVDPPYLAGVATYNKKWTEQEEIDLYAMLDGCTKKGIKWLLSNAIKNNGSDNRILGEWLSDHKHTYKVFRLNREYTTSNFRRKNNGKTVEIMVKNY